MGFVKVERMLVAGVAGLLLGAADGARDGRRKLRALAPDVPERSELTAAELGAAFGRDAVVHVALRGGPLAAALARELDRLSGFRVHQVGCCGKRMSETNDTDTKRPLSLGRGGKLELRKPVESGQVRQSFPHGRTKTVTVEVRKKRIVDARPTPERRRAGSTHRDGGQGRDPGIGRRAAAPPRADAARADGRGRRAPRPRPEGRHPSRRGSEAPGGARRRRPRPRGETPRGRGGAEPQGLRRGEAQGRRGSEEKRRGRDQAQGRRGAQGRRDQAQGRGR